MKIEKLLAKAKSFLSSSARKRKEKRKCLKEVLQALKKHEKALKKRLENGDDKAAKLKIKKEIALTRAHRKKGLKNLKALPKA